MTIDIDVAATAKHFGLDPKLLQAVVLAEGTREDTQAIVRAVQCSIPSVKTRQEALEITARSAIHAMGDFLKLHTPTLFVDFWADRWAPVGAKNDPTALNKNWPDNLKNGWLS